jgi:hypothetical protein
MHQSVSISERLGLGINRLDLILMFLEGRQSGRPLDAKRGYWFCSIFVANFDNNIDTMEGMKVT